ncbi:glycosyltransferase family 32 protein [Lasiosphaeris hirsuta]|uniref:Glycosyltransferase family 32 protein n=1 Tax=Lasiosphaeris hirsuta TaxID=260670 RepID=A0AA40AQJ4_9PEZI|nr:glycosyltransferase family 32 protein [Lasiosphaeris hirsuta]
MRVSIRISVILWGLALLTCLGVGISRLLVFGQIFFDHSGIAIIQPEVAEVYTGVNETRPQLIPKIIHQVFHNWRSPGNDTLPSDWENVRLTCTNANPGWEYKLWTEKASRGLIETEYPWFLTTYDRYRYPVQRVDAIRYFLLLHYGGIYLDLDNGCKGDLTPLLYYPMWITDGGRGALSNNILASRPNHPFWNRLTLSLIPYNYDWFFPYVTISYASGQWFETAIWEQYHSLLPPVEDNPDIEHRLYRLMMDDRPGADEWVFFTQERGGTWVNWDNYMFLMIGDHLVVFALIVLGSISFAIWLGTRLTRRYREGYLRQKGLPNQHMISSIHAPL